MQSPFRGIHHTWDPLIPNVLVEGPTIPTRLLYFYHYDPKCRLVLLIYRYCDALEDPLVGKTLAGTSHL